jgi:hypothetical protein
MQYLRHYYGQKQFLQEILLVYGKTCFIRIISLADLGLSSVWNEAYIAWVDKIAFNINIEPKKKKRKQKVEGII